MIILNVDNAAEELQPGTSLPQITRIKEEILARRAIKLLLLRSCNSLPKECLHAFFFIPATCSNALIVRHSLDVEADKKWSGMYLGYEPCPTFDGNYNHRLNR